MLIAICVSKNICFDLFATQYVDIVYAWLPVVIQFFQNCEYHSQNLIFLEKIG